MSQQIPTNGGTPHIKNINDYGRDVSYVRRLFLHTGFDFMEVANSRGKVVDDFGNTLPCARIVDEYNPPSPSMKTAELKISNAPSKIHADGKASYRIVLRLLFPDKYTYNDFIFFCGNEFKFYDEKGAIFLGSLIDTPEIKRVEGGRRYDIRITLTATRKEYEELKENIHYTDLTTDQVHRISISSSIWSGNIPVHFKFPVANLEFDVYRDMDKPATPMYYVSTIRSVFIQRDVDKYYTIKLGASNSILLTPKRDDYKGDIIINPGLSNLSIGKSTDGGDHWAKDYIESSTRLGFFAQYDSDGNHIYTFNPNEYTTRAQMAVVLNRFKRYIERVIRG